MTDHILLCLALFLLGNVCKLKAQSCGGTYHYYGNYGVLQSPNYPNAYSNNCRCIYVIYLSTTSSILLTFETFELDRYSSTGDYVTISCASNSSFNQITYYWNSVATPISIPWCSYARIDFVSDSYNSYSVRGFRIQYQVSTIGCGKTVYGESSGNLTSPNYPQSYNNNENCTSLIWASQPSSIALNFQSFSLQWGSSTCPYDWVQIRCDSTSYTLLKHCGSTIPVPVIIKNCNQVLIWFRTDGSVVSSGFSLQYFVTPNGCSQSNYTGLSGLITSPNYPQRFRNIDCCYYLHPVSSITLTFVSFDLEPFVDNANGDYVEIICVNRPDYGTQTFRGNTLPPPITFPSCSLVRVCFNASNNVLSGTGFQLQYQVKALVAYGAIIKKPVNTAANVGTRVQLNCTSNVNGYLPSWTLSRDGSDESATVIASYCVVNSGYTSQYSVISDGLGVCNLVIRNATLAQAGVYTCTDVSLAFFSAIVSVIEVVPTADKQPEVVKGDVLLFQYVVNFASSVVPAPTTPMLIQWNSAGKTVVSSVVSQPDIVVSSLNVTAEPEVVPSYGFTVYFSAPLNRNDYAVNAPTFKYHENSTPYIVLYWPEESNMTITGNIGGYIAYNGSLQCNVSSNPPSNYSWLDHTSGIFTNGSTVYATHSGTYTCNASNVIRGKTYWFSKLINVSISSPTTTSTAKPDIAVIVLSALLAACVVGFIVLATYYFVHRFRVKPSSPQNGNRHSTDNNVISEPRSSNEYTSDVHRPAVYQNIPIQVIQSGSSTKAEENDSNCYAQLNHAYHEPATYASLTKPRA